MKNEYVIEQKNQYLEKLGLQSHRYGINFMTKNDLKTKKGKKKIKQWKKQQKKYGFDSRETWVLNTIFVEWMYSHLKMYLKKAGEIIDLSYYKFEYNGKTYTQKEMIKKMIKCFKYYLINADVYENEEKAIKKAKKGIEIWNMVFANMWW